MKKDLLCLLFLLTSLGLSATPARRGFWRTLTLTDGSEVRAELRGDARYHFYQDAEGVRYTQVPGTGRFEVFSGSVRRPSDRKAAVRSPRRIPIGSEHAPLVGIHRELIILVNFTNSKFEEGHTQTLYDRIANEENFVDMSLGFLDGSVHDYFLAQSDGRFTMAFDVVGPVTLPHPYAYYGHNAYYGTIDGQYVSQDDSPELMIIDAVKAVDAEVDFSRYDNDGDGYADQIFVLYAGKNEGAGGDEDTVWPHKFSLTEAGRDVLTCDGVKVNDYACSSELTPVDYVQVSATEYQPVFGLAGIGVLCHEFSHCLGLPDVYDVAYQNYGMNTWSIMDAGEWNGIEHPGYTPPAYTAYERMYCGWRQPTELRGDTLIRGMKPITRGGETFIIRNPAHPDEYYLLENRQLDSWDRALDYVSENDKMGLIVTHVDFDAKVWAANEVNCTDPDYSLTGNSHQRLHVVAADNSYASEKVDPVTGYGYYDYQDVRDDAFPQSGKDSLTNTSIPRANLYNINTDGRKLLNVGILNIRQNADGTIDFDFRGSAGDGGNVEAEVFFAESFDQCSGTGGNDGLWGGSASVASSTLRADNDGWSTNNAFGADRCARFGASRGSTIATSPEFGISGTAEVVFKAAPWQGDATDLKLSLYSDDDDISSFSLGQTSFTMTPGRWTEFRTTLTGDGKVRLRFQPSRRFFLDEVRVQTPGGQTDVDAPRRETPDDRQQEVYDLSGRRVTESALTSSRSGRKGIYIQGKRKVVK